MITKPAAYTTLGIVVVILAFLLGLYKQEFSTPISGNTFSWSSDQGSKFFRSGILIIAFIVTVILMMCAVIRVVSVARLRWILRRKNYMEIADGVSSKGGNIALSLAYFVGGFIGAHGIGILIRNIVSSDMRLDAWSLAVLGISVGIGLIVGAKLSTLLLWPVTRRNSSSSL